MPEGLREKRGVTVHSVPSNTLRGAQKRQKTPFRVAILGFSVTSAALHSQKTPRGILPVNRNILASCFGILYEISWTFAFFCDIIRIVTIIEDRSNWKGEGYGSLSL